MTDKPRLVLVALGGNALLRRGEPMTAAAQRANVRIAAEALAPVARRHRLVLSHGNGPQVGLLALQALAYSEAEPYPLDILAAETEGMIGYLIEQELGNLLPFEVPFATILTMVEVDPTTRRSTTRRSSSVPATTNRRPRSSGSSTAGRSSPTAIAGAASSPPRADADLRAPAHPLAAGEGDDRHLRRRWRYPHDVRARRHADARRRRGDRRQGSRERAARARDRGGRLCDGDGRGRRVPRLGHPGRPAARADYARGAPRPRLPRRLDAAEGRSSVRVRRADGRHGRHRRAGRHRGDRRRPDRHNRRAG